MLRVMTVEVRCSAERDNVTETTLGLVRPAEGLLLIRPLSTPEWGLGPRVRTRPESRWGLAPRRLSASLALRGRQGAGAFYCMVISYSMHFLMGHEGEMPGTAREK